MTLSRWSHAYIHTYIQTLKFQFTFTILHTHTNSLYCKKKAPGWTCRRLRRPTTMRSSSLTPYHAKTCSWCPRSFRCRTPTSYTGTHTDEGEEAATDRENSAIHTYIFPPSIDKLAWEKPTFADTVRSTAGTESEKGCAQSTTKAPLLFPSW